MSYDPDDEVTVISAEGVGRGILRGNTIHLTKGAWHVPRQRR